MTPPRILILAIALLVAFATFRGMAEAQAATFTVNSTADPGDGVCDASECTLREAIGAANANAGTDTITFNIPGDGAHTIRPASALPTITDPVIIDGYTQPGASPNTNGPGLGSNAVLKIELDGTDAGTDANGLHITGGSSTVRGLVINRFGQAPSGKVTRNGIVVETNGGNLIEGNFIGTDITGTAARGNGDAGIGIRSANNTLGGTTPAARNVIAGNGNTGIAIVFSAARENTVQGNFIGTDVTGGAALPNGGHGIVVNQSANNLIGGATPAARNLVSANGLSGIAILNTNGPNLVQGNLIGTAVDSTSPLGNGSHGVIIGSIVRSPASDNTVGGTTADTGNVIAHNRGGGVFVESGTGNAVLGNFIFSNLGLGVDLDADGVTPNDTADGDTGANNLQNFPVVTRAEIKNSGDLVVQYSVDSATGNSAYPLRVEFFEADSVANGEGKTFLGSVSYPASSARSSNASSLGSAAGLGVASGDAIVATATDANNNTSEFSQGVGVTAVATPIPGLTRWGLLIMAVVVGALLLWRIARPRRREPA